MPELKNEFQIPRAEATLFQDEDQLNFRLATSKLSDLGGARELVQTSQVSVEAIPSPEFGAQEAIRIDEWLEWMRAAYGDANWDLKD